MIPNTNIAVNPMDYVLRRQWRDLWIHTDEHFAKGSNEFSKFCFAPPINGFSTMYEQC